MNLKYRVWNRVTQTMITPESKTDLVMMGMNGEIFINNRLVDKEDVKVMWCTGLRDSNGKEIYDGDFVQAFKPNSYLDGVYEVAWHETKGRWYYRDQPSYKDLYQVGSAGNLKCKVMGNIYEGIGIQTKV